MFPRLLLVSILLLLGACQSPRIERDFDTSRDFAAYRSWSWQEPALQYRPDDPRLRSDLTEQRIRSAIEQQLEQRGLRPAVIAAARSKPFLGICIGEQMLFAHSEEGDAAGLGIFPGSVQRFPAARMHGADGSRLKVPHMGWNTVAQKKPHPLWAGIADHSRFYFVHSYCVQAPDSALCAGTTDYGLSFTSAVAQDNIFAVQFHPEKSARDGLQLLKNFVEWHP